MEKTASGGMNTKSQCVPVHMRMPRRTSFASLPSGSGAIKSTSRISLASGFKASPPLMNFTSLTLIFVAWQYRWCRGPGLHHARHRV